MSGTAAGRKDTGLSPGGRGRSSSASHDHSQRARSKPVGIVVAAQDLADANRNGVAHLHKTGEKVTATILDAGDARDARRRLDRRLKLAALERLAEDEPIRGEEGSCRSRAR